MAIITANGTVNNYYLCPAAGACRSDPCRAQPPAASLTRCHSAAMRSSCVLNLWKRAGNGIAHRQETCCCIGVLDACNLCPRCTCDLPSEPMLSSRSRAEQRHPSDSALTDALPFMAAVGRHPSWPRPNCSALRRRYPSTFPTHLPTSRTHPSRTLPITIRRNDRRQTSFYLFFCSLDHQQPGRSLVPRTGSCRPCSSASRIDWDRDDRLCQGPALAGPAAQLQGSPCLPRREAASRIAGHSYMPSDADQ